MSRLASLGVSRCRELLLLVLVSKVLVVVVVVFAYAYLPFQILSYPRGEPIHLGAAFRTWDANGYIWLSESWYVRGSGHFLNSYYPLFPALIGVVNRLTGNALLSGLLVSNLLSLAAFYVFYRFVEAAHGPSIATGALTFLIAFPTAFYFSLIYTESLFLLLAVSFFLCLAHGAYVRAWLLALLLPLARPLGVAIVIPFLIERIAAARRCRSAIDGVSTAGVRAAPVPGAWWTVALVAAPLVGFLVYLTVMGLATGNPFEGIQSQRLSVGGWRLSNLLHPERFLRNLLLEPPHLVSYTSSIVDRGFFLFFLVLCPLVYRVSGAGLLAYAIVLGCTPPLLGSFMSYRRYLVAIFPLFIALAYATESGRLGAIRTPLIILFAGLQAFFLALHALNYWVG